MITDPPYGVEYDAAWRNNVVRANVTRVGDRATGKVLNDNRADWTETWRLFPGDVAYVWHDGRNAAEVQRSIEEAQFEIRAQIIWAKQQFAIGRGDYHWKHEPCWYAVRKGSAAKFKGDRTQTTLWEIDKPQKSETGHSTQKPLECMARPIRNHVGNVYEPFAGSGTTMVAAENLGRTCYAVELHPPYCAVILDRMKTAFPGIEIKRI
jgi:DNA modification methylase